mmetsp:Transcript_73034/g.159715  ORF Transcript_73034/g.159715 Transcript_73034/m.159715 type:complete len:221 (-) Transcript_73034:318-980(-)
MLLPLLLLLVVFLVPFLLLDVDDDAVNSLFLLHDAEIGSSFSLLNFQLLQGIRSDSSSLLGSDLQNPSRCVFWNTMALADSSFEKHGLHVADIATVRKGLMRRQRFWVFLQPTSPTFFDVWASIETIAATLSEGAIGPANQFVHISRRLQDGPNAVTHEAFCALTIDLSGIWHNVGAAVVCLHAAPECPPGIADFFGMQAGAKENSTTAVAALHEALRLG